MLRILNISNRLIFNPSTLTSINYLAAEMCYLPPAMAKSKRSTSDPNEIQKDTDKLVRFLSMYCNAHHGHRLRSSFTFDHPKIQARVINGPDLCNECVALLRHAIVMRVLCPLDPKPKCRTCPQHCYRPVYKDQMETVMKYAGPRSLFKRS